MVDLLKLQFSLEDNLLLMKQLNCFPTENEKKDVIVNAGRLQIALVSSVNQLGFQWISHCPLFTSEETGTSFNSFDLFLLASLGNLLKIEFPLFYLIKSY